MPEVWCSYCHGMGTIECQDCGDTSACLNYGWEECPQCGGDGEYFVPDEDEGDEQ